MLYATSITPGLRFYRTGYRSGQAEEQGSFNAGIPGVRFSMFHWRTAIWMLYPQNRRVPHKVQAFIDFMVERLGCRPTVYWEETH